MKFTFVTLFPDIIDSYFSESILSRARKLGLIQTEFVNPRDFSTNKFRKVDEYMVGGGAGLLLMPQPLNDTLNFINLKNKNTHFIFLTPVAKKFNQNDAKRLSKKEHICFVCGRYEGIDERVIEKWADEVFSIGDFVLTGGELGSLCMTDAISRNLKMVLGNSQSLDVESFEGDILEAPAFTKPNVFENSCVVSDFLKGNHATIQDLKNTMALCKTRYFRPDLYQKTRPQLRKNNEK